MPFEITHISQSDQLRLEMIRIKGQFRKMGRLQYLHEFLQNFPEYNNNRGIIKVRNVWACAMADRDIINKFKQLLIVLENENKL